MNQIIGLECGLKDGDLRNILRWLAESDYDVFIRHIYKIDSKTSKIPSLYENINIHSSNLKNYLHSSIWELVFYLYPPESNKQSIDTYEDYLHSQCIGCFIYYDCGFVDFYTKDMQLLREMDNLTTALNAEDKSFITDRNRRTIMHL